MRVPTPDTNLCVVVFYAVLHVHAHARCQRARAHGRSCLAAYASASANAVLLLRCLLRGAHAHTRLRRRGRASMQRSVDRHLLQPPSVSALAITSIHLPHLQLMLSDPIRAASCVLGHRVLQPLRVYFDGNGVLPVIPNVTWVNLSIIAPWAAQYAVEQSDWISPVQRAYRAMELYCNVAKDFFRTGRCKDVYTIFKVAAIHHAVTTRAARWIIWLDVDAYMVRPLGRNFWMWMQRYDVATTFRWPSRPPDTGVLLIRADARGELLMKTVVSFYYDRELYLAAGGVNDVFIFGYLLNTTCSHSSMCSAATKVLASRSYLRVGDFGTSETWAQSPDPYKISKYLPHDKGSGPMEAGGAGNSAHNQTHFLLESRRHFTVSMGFNAPIRTFRGSVFGECPQNPAHGWWRPPLARARADCSTSSEGSWLLNASESADWTRTMRSCERRCLACENCRYISFSWRWKDCRWLSSCDMKALEPHTGFQTIAVARHESGRAPGARAIR